VPKSSARDRLRGWARAWIERFKPYTNFIDSLKIPEDEVAFYANLFFETLANDKVLNCELMAMSGNYAYLRCEKMFVKTFAGVFKILPTTVIASTRPIKAQGEIAKFFENIAGMLAVSYFYLPIDVVIYEGKEIEVKGLRETLGETKISEIHVGEWWITVRFEPRSRGDVTFTLERSGEISITWAGDIERKKLEDIAEQDLVGYIQELDRALTDFYNVVKTGMKGVVNYILY